MVRFDSQAFRPFLTKVAYLAPGMKFGILFCTLELVYKNCLAAFGR